MTCPHKVPTPNGPQRCGNCPDCVQTKRNALVARLELESHAWAGRINWGTLTYAPQNLPFTRTGVPTLLKADMQKFWKRCRSKYDGVLRNYYCGELGHLFGRPHYHYILFGPTPDEAQRLVADCWQNGSAQCEPVTSRDALGYVTKYLDKPTPAEIEKLKALGVEMPFARWSLKPPLGDPGVRILSRQYNEHAIAAQTIGLTGDVAHAVKLGHKRTLPLWRWGVDSIRKDHDVPLLGKDRKPSRLIRLEDPKALERAIYNEARVQRIKLNGGGKL